MLAAVVAVGCGGANAGRGEVASSLALEHEVIAWHAGWRADRTAFAAGFSPGGLFIATDPAGVRVGAKAIAGVPAPVRASAAPAVDSEGDGVVAWVADVNAAGGREVRSTAVLTRDGRAWHVVLDHESVALPADEARQREETGSWRPLIDIPDGITDGAQPLAQLLSEALGSADALAAIVSKRPGVQAFGPAPGDRFTGTYEVGEFLRSLFHREGARLRRAGGMRGALVGRGDAGWIATNVELVVSRGEHDYIRPCRMTAVFVREGDAWTLVQLHLSHAAEEG